MCFFPKCLRPFLPAIQLCYWLNDYQHLSISGLLTCRPSEYMDYLYPNRIFRKTFPFFFQEIGLLLVPWERFSMVQSFVIIRVPSPLEVSFLAINKCLASHGVGLRKSVGVMSVLGIVLLSGKWIQLLKLCTGNS